MGDKLYAGLSRDRYKWKNSHRKYSKLSKYKIEKILDCFVRDLSITEAWQEISSWRNKGAISKKTISRKYWEMRRLFVDGALTYLDLFGGAGAVSLIGLVPEKYADKIDGSKRRYIEKGKYVEFPNRLYFLERVLRAYARQTISISQVYVILDFSLVKMSQANKEEHWRNFGDYGCSYIAQANWGLGDTDFGLREDELWEKIFSTPFCSAESYYERMMRDMKWLMRRHPLGTGIFIKGGPTYQPDRKTLLKAGLEWFPEGYNRK